jgi:hypothetical protein
LVRLLADGICNPEPCNPETCKALDKLILNNIDHADIFFIFIFN